MNVSRLASATTLIGVGALEIVSGGLAVGTVVSSGGVADVAAGTAIGAQIFLSGTIQQDESGGASLITEAAIFDGGVATWISRPSFIT